MATSLLRQDMDEDVLSSSHPALIKLLVSVIRADSLVRKEELDEAAEILFKRLKLDRDEGYRQLQIALQQPEHVRTLGSCLKELSENGMTADLIRDLLNVAYSDGEYHVTEQILVEGLSGMLARFETPITARKC